MTRDEATEVLLCHCADQRGQLTTNTTLHCNQQVGARPGGPLRHYAPGDLAYHKPPHLFREEGSPESSEANGPSGRVSPCRSPSFRVRRKPFLNALTVAARVYHTLFPAVPAVDNTFREEM